MPARISVSALALLFSFANQCFAGGLETTYVHRDVIAGTQIVFPTSGQFDARLRGSRIAIDFQIYVSLHDLQNKITGMLRPMVNKSDDCGDVIRLQSVRLRPTADGRARADVEVDYARWYCTYADIPETRCTDTWIPLPFGGKTKGIPNCTVTMRTRQTSKNKVIETGVSGTLLLTPSLVGNDRVELRGDVTSVRVRNDLVRFATEIFDVNLRSLAQNALEENLGNGGAIQQTAPAELQPYLDIDQAEFYDAGSGKLGIRANGSFEVSYSQISSLCQKYTSFCR